jgi:hypothetical protein
VYFGYSNTHVWEKSGDCIFGEDEIHGFILHKTVIFRGTGMIT